MNRIRRNERLAVLSKLLNESPNRLQTLSQYCELFETAKSSMSEDINILREVYRNFGLGKIETITGAAGGVVYKPHMPWHDALEFVNDLSAEMSTGSRMLPGGFLYLSDVLSHPQSVTKMGKIIAQRYENESPDFVLTMETKGIPVALIVAQTLDVPLVIARRSGKVYEGPAVNINYVTGSSGTIETMSLSRRAIKDWKRTLIVDDFIKAGGTAKGMIELMQEFNVEVVGSAFVMSTLKPEKKCISDETALMVMEGVNDDQLIVKPAQWLQQMVEVEKNEM